MKVIDIEGIGPAHAAKLQGAGVKTVEALLARAAKPKGREELEKATGISAATILEWVNRADLYRIKGVASENRTCSRRRVSTRRLSWPTASRPIWRPSSPRSTRPRS